jgi:hypothetical protein
MIEDGNGRQLDCAAKASHTDVPRPVPSEG